MDSNNNEMTFKSLTGENFNSNYIKFKKELVLDKNEYNKPKELEDLLAVAQNIQNIMFIEPGTYPNQPELGVGIENYKFEFLDTSTINELEDKINKQIDKFIISTAFIKCNVSTIDNDINKKIILITFTIKKNNESNDAIILALFKNNNKVISKIII